MTRICSSWILPSGPRYGKRKEKWRRQLLQNPASLGCSGIFCNHVTSTVVSSSVSFSLSFVKKNVHKKREFVNCLISLSPCYYGNNKVYIRKKNGHIIKTRASVRTAVLGNESTPSDQAPWHAGVSVTCYTRASDVNTHTEVTSAGKMIQYRCGSDQMTDWINRRN